MNTRAYNDLQISNNLYNFRSGRKRFPNSNLHYSSSLGQSSLKLPPSRQLSETKTRDAKSLLYKHSNQMTPKQFHPPKEESLELESLRRQLAYKNKQILELKKMIQGNSSIEKTVPFRRLKSRLNKRLEPLHKETSPYARGILSRTPNNLGKQPNNIFITKKNPRIDTNNPITGLSKALN